MPATSDSAATLDFSQRFLTVAETARYLRISPKTLSRIPGDLLSPCHPSPGRLAYDVKDLDAYMFRSR
jgi:hypothetical protein